jgi:hypothetical protein
MRGLTPAAVWDGAPVGGCGTAAPPAVVRVERAGERGGPAGGLGSVTEGGASTEREVYLSTLWSHAC